MEMIPYDNGRFGLKPLLFGFIPIKVPFLDTLEFSFKRVEGDMLSAVYSDGIPLLAIGMRVDQLRLSQNWLARQGTYEAIDLGDDFPIISPLEVMEKEGFLLIDGKLCGILPFSLMLTPAGDGFAFWGGLGRGSGETFAFEEKDGETFIHYAGCTYRKNK